MGRPRPAERQTRETARRRASNHRPREATGLRAVARAPGGAFQGAFFASLGYGIDNWQDLDRALRAAAGQAEAELGERTPYGQKYRIRSMLQGPAGRSADIVSVWTPRLGTVMPRG